MRLTDNEYKALTGKEPPPATSRLLQIEGVNHGSHERASKYAAIPTEVDGIRFASKKEARRYEELRDLQKYGEITNLDLQKNYALVVKDVKVGVYRADFVYEQRGNLIVEDVKGYRCKASPVYKLFLLKKKLLKALYGIDVQEV